MSPLPAPRAAHLLQDPEDLEGRDWGSPLPHQKANSTQEHQNQLLYSSAQCAADPTPPPLQGLPPSLASPCAPVLNPPSPPHPPPPNWHSSTAGSHWALDLGPWSSASVFEFSHQRFRGPSPQALLVQEDGQLLASLLIGPGLEQEGCR